MQFYSFFFRFFLFFFCFFLGGGYQFTLCISLFSLTRIWKHVSSNRHFCHSGKRTSTRSPSRETPRCSRQCHHIDNRKFYYRPLLRRNAIVPVRCPNHCAGITAYFQLPKTPIPTTAGGITAELGSRTFFPSSFPRKQDKLANFHFALLLVSCVSPVSSRRLMEGRDPGEQHGPGELISHSEAGAGGLPLSVPPWARTPPPPYQDLFRLTKLKVSPGGDFPFPGCRLYLR